MCILTKPVVPGALVVPDALVGLDWGKNDNTVRSLKKSFVSMVTETLKVGKCIFIVNKLPNIFLIETRKININIM